MNTDRVLHEALWARPREEAGTDEIGASGNEEAVLRVGTHSHCRKCGNTPGEEAHCDRFGMAIVLLVFVHEAQLMSSVVRHCLKNLHAGELRPVVAKVT